MRFLGSTGVVSLLTERRRHAPKGLQGGADGRPGRNVLVRSGRQTELPGKALVAVRRDDLVVVETPGGGGWGSAP